VGPASGFDIMSTSGLALRLLSDPDFPAKLRGVELAFIARADDDNAPFLKNYRDFVGADAPEDIRTRNLDAILRIHHASLAGASTKVLDETFAELVWPLQNELEQRAAVVKQASATTIEELQRAAARVRSHRMARIAAALSFRATRTWTRRLRRSRQ
jgi:hypothetical protein